MVQYPSGGYDKKALREYVVEMLQGKIKTLSYYLNFTLDATREIKKTSKYDSIREEMQEEIYHLDKQMASLKLMQQNMRRVLSEPTEVVKVGSLVITQNSRFYISISLGEFFFDSLRYYAISPESPMARLMLGKKPGESLVLGKIRQEIREVY
ncbi:GreA/GreB family elongation factor [Planobacterium oryzisoli]|uniref:GreA/GreB family elongation factor n=1 Tax=Planobacterium oryzisoli TaxID=2771435 RepID=A0A931EAA6_9FLAO|nr:hypothetical protein [Planobacterium oryzisoli]MBF5027173.1 hypothetical protein [Planobacterium oryzisoli]